MLAKMAKTNGVVCKNEITAISNFFDEMELDSEDKKSAITIFHNAKTDGATIYEYADQYATIADKEMREIIYTMLWEVSLADGELHENEEIILKTVTHNLGIPESRYHEFRTRSQNSTSYDIKEYYDILGCVAEDTDQEIKQKYRKAIVEYHPDKIQSKGLPEGFHRFANEQTRKINNAYEIIINHRKNT